MTVDFTHHQNNKHLHSVPCQIQYTGEANVSKYFIYENLAKNHSSNLDEIDEYENASKEKELPLDPGAQSLTDIDEYVKKDQMNKMNEDENDKENRKQNKKENTQNDGTIKIPSISSPPISSVMDASSKWQLSSSFRGRPWLGYILSSSSLSDLKNGQNNYQYSLMEMSKIKMDRSFGNEKNKNIDHELINQKVEVEDDHENLDVDNEIDTDFSNVLIERSTFDTIFHWEWDPLDNQPSSFQPPPPSPHPTENSTFVHPNLVSMDKTEIQKDSSSFHRPSVLADEISNGPRFQSNSIAFLEFAHILNRITS